LLVDYPDGLGGRIYGLARQSELQQVGEEVARAAAQINYGALKFDILFCYSRDGIAKDFTEMIFMSRLISSEIFPKAVDTLPGPIYFMVV